MGHTPGRARRWAWSIPDAHTRRGKGLPDHPSHEPGGQGPSGEGVVTSRQPGPRPRPRRGGRPGPATAAAPLMEDPRLRPAVDDIAPGHRRRRVKPPARSALSSMCPRQAPARPAGRGRSDEPGVQRGRDHTKLKLHVFALPNSDDLCDRLDATSCEPLIPHTGVATIGATAGQSNPLAQVASTLKRHSKAENEPPQAFGECAVAPRNRCAASRRRGCGEINMIDVRHHPRKGIRKSGLSSRKTK
ncbi:hypothetical protein SCOCK_90101 [Actinacidiphila cocklensis]|uniref:Uncharacterized protein n=1 Tax=Actinacidiphila cocklensis TaxID=887465 RepID=A0A9W4GVJ5_9ACTN|nr:hypothetical protein SCOCK_90101 [Actinacidiphila cocklensis]